MNEENQLAVIPENQLTNAQFAKQHNQIVKFVKDQLRESKNIAGGESGDYGIIPYTKKKSLLKPGAEKLLKLFGLAADNVCIKEVEDWDKRFVMYKYKCTITHIASGKVIASATRSCNNKEKKHSTKDVYDVANTIESVAQKRALVAATVQATMASEIFDADVSEHDEEAPNRSVTQDEDPRRARVRMGLYGVAGRHGWDDDWIHRAIKKKWGFESLTECSNDQIEELKEFIEEKYEEVEKGEKPKLRVSQPKLDPVEGEIVEEGKAVYNCQGPAHKETGIDVPVDEVGGWCSEQCRIDYFGPEKTEEKEPWKKGFGKKNEASAAS